VILGLAALLAIAGVKMWAAAGDVRTFRIALAGNAVPTASAYRLTTAIVDGKKRYFLRINRRLSDDTAWIGAFKTGTGFSNAVVDVLDDSLQVVTTYTLANPVVTAVEHNGLAADAFVSEEIVLRSASLSVTTP
jgi:hypothetical protein